MRFPEEEKDQCDDSLQGGIKNLMYRVERGATMQFAKGCAPYLALPFTLAVISLVIGIFLDGILVHLWTLILFVVSFGMLIFFRDPDLPIGEGVVSPANGKVTGIDRTGDRVVVKVFMNVWNIHVNRCPLKGKVLSVVHKEGGHIPAFNKDAEQNERVITELETEIGNIQIVQIAGSVARRIVPYITEGQELGKGDRIGIIRLGSRVDLHLPASEVDIVVKIGDAVRPGQTVAKVRIEPGESNNDPGDGHRDPTEKAKGQETEAGKGKGQEIEGEKGKGQEDAGGVEREP